MSVRERVLEAAPETFVTRDEIDVDCSDGYLLQVLNDLEREGLVEKDTMDVDSRGRPPVIYRRVDRSHRQVDWKDPLRRGEKLSWDCFEFEIPDDLTPGKLRDAVEVSDRLYSVCDELGISYEHKGAIRVLCKNEGLYLELECPEGIPKN